MKMGRQNKSKKSEPEKVNAIKRILHGLKVYAGKDRKIIETEHELIAHPDSIKAPYPVTHSFMEVPDYMPPGAVRIMLDGDHLVMSARWDLSNMNKMPDMDDVGRHAGIFGQNMIKALWVLAGKQKLMDKEDN